MRTEPVYPCDRCGVEFCKAMLKTKVVKKVAGKWCKVCRKEYKDGDKVVKKVYKEDAVAKCASERKVEEKHLKAFFDAGMKKWGLEVSPVPCHLCGNPYMYIGHAHAMAMGVKCLKCGLKMEIEYDVLERTEKDKDGSSFTDVMFAYDKWLVEEVIYKWNNRGCERAKIIDHSKDKN